MLSCLGDLLQLIRAGTQENALATDFVSRVLEGTAVLFMAQDVSHQANVGIMVLIGKESGEAYKDDDEEEEDGGGNFSYVTDEEGQWSRTKMGSQWPNTRLIFRRR